MKTRAIAFGLAAQRCSRPAHAATRGRRKRRARSADQAGPEDAGTKTIGAGLAPNSRFMAAAKSAGLDQTLAGPGPYTVFVPDDAAFNGAPAGTLDPKPQNRAQLTGIITNLILPGTVMVADIDKAIDNGKGKTLLGTMAGSTLTATKDGGKIVLTNSSGHKAKITQGDEQYTNGVVHHIDTLLMPSKPSNGPAVGQKVHE